tara:strand:+ start:1059 stop:1472 length:414 start_codon:yes stop_codon:yes gene_type:complete
MIAKDSREWYRALNQRCDHLEDGRLTVGNIMMYLISREQDEVWLLEVQDLTQKLYSQWVGYACRQKSTVLINCIFARADTSDHVCVGDPGNLECAVFFTVSLGVGDCGLGLPCRKESLATGTSDPASNSRGSRKTIH